MAIIVQKFGGTSVATIERISMAAQHIKNELDNGNQVAVVVSAMAGTTSALSSLVKQASQGRIFPAEYDAIVSTGEQITCGLLSIILQTMGIEAQSWMGWQLPIITDETHANSNIIDINCGALQACLHQGKVPIIAGFQGVSQDQRITTLGRGGSDTTAVAIAHALNAQRCDIFTDVEGVFTADPQIIPAARKIDTISYDVMLLMAKNGAKVLQTKSVALAMKHNVKIEVKSTFSHKPGTIVSHYDESQRHLHALCCASDVTLITWHDPNPIFSTQASEILKKNNIEYLFYDVSQNEPLHQCNLAIKKDLADFVITLFANEDTATEMGKAEQHLQLSYITIVYDRLGIDGHELLEHTKRTLEQCKNPCKGQFLKIITRPNEIGILIDKQQELLAIQSLHDMLFLKI